MLFLGVIVKTLAVAHGQPITFVALLEHASPAVILSCATIGVGSAAAALLVGRGSYYLANRRYLASCVSLLGGLAVAAALVPSPVGLILPLAAVGVVNVCVLAVVNRRLNVDTTPRIPLGLWIGQGALIYVLVLGTSDVPWLPPERIDRGSGPSVIGYVVSTESDSIVVLVDDGRQVLYIPSAEVTSRTICATNPSTRAPLRLYEVAYSSKRYPACRS